MSESSPLANSFRSRRASRSSAPSESADDRGASRERQPVRQRRRKKVGKRSNPRYAQALGYVRKDVHSRVIERALTDPVVVRELIVELDEFGIEHKPGKVDYGALVELWSVQWLESVGYGLEE